MMSGMNTNSKAIHGSTEGMPYRIACLCDLRDAQGRVLLLKRLKAPNQGLISPIGGKLDVAHGESPAACAIREIHEEAGIEIAPERIHLFGLVSERAFEGKGHWLMFVYRVLGPVWVEPQDIREGRLDWYQPTELESLAIPETDRKIIWPLMRRAEPKTAAGRPGFFAVHIDCDGPEISWRIEQEIPGT